MSPDCCGRCGTPAGPSPARCSKCGAAFCPTCAQLRDQAGRGPECTGIAPKRADDEEILRGIQTGDIRLSERRPLGK